MSALTFNDLVKLVFPVHCGLYTVHFSCSTANWRFDSKKKLFAWARDERDLRWNVKHLFADVEESLNFKTQNLMYRVFQLEKEYKDILSLIHSKEQPNEMKSI